MSDEERMLVALTEAVGCCSPLVREPLTGEQAIESTTAARVVARLSRADRFLPVWILTALAMGLVGGQLIPGLGRTLETISVDGISLPIALGLLVTSLLLNWVLGPALNVRPGLAAVAGPARLPHADLTVSAWRIARSVLIFLGIPLLAGYLTRRIGERAKGRFWYEQRLLPQLGPFALYGLLFTIVILFALQGLITSQPLHVARIALPGVLAELVPATATP